jgi:protoporphyrinogen oxidase/cytochrome b involved in lipid metabolism
MFSNYDYDIVIIGGGISGIFLAYKLLNTNLKVILFEGDNRLGGRIETYDKNGSVFEAGAARIHRSHGKVVSLIHDLDLIDDLVRIPEEIDSILRNHKNDYPYQTKWKGLTMDVLLKKSVESKDRFEEKELQRITFFQYLTLIYDHETATYIKDSFGYDSEFVDLNASSAIDMFEGDLFGDNHYYLLKNGLSQLINKMKKEILKTGTIIKTGTSIKEITDTHVVTHKGVKFFFDHLICAIPHLSLKQFEYFKDVELIDSVKPIPLLRIYAKYPTKDLWFKNIKRTTTDNYIRQIIPIDYESGLIMISYTDGKNTEYWESYLSLGEEYLIKALHKEIKDLFGIDPPDPEFISSHYWKDGFHLWKLGEESQKVSKNLLKPIKGKEVYLCGEAYSLKQGWIEGALDTCYQILHMLPPLEQYQKVKYEYMCEDIPQPDKVVDGGVEEEVKEKKVEKKKVEEKKVDPKNTKLSLDQVIEEDEWIILEVNGKKNVYDISEWIPKHPGGSAILRGVEANKHYQNPKLYPDSPTDLFKGNHVHEEAGAWEKYVEKNNDVVILIGYID